MNVAAWRQWVGPALSARCVENGVFGLAANYVGTVSLADTEQSFPGGGIVLGPRGEERAEWTVATGKTGILVCDLSAEELLRARAEPEYLFRLRRPELYRSLAE